MRKPIEFKAVKQNHDYDVREYKLIVDSNVPISWNDIWNHFDELDGFLTVLIPEKRLSYATTFSIRLDKMGPLPDWVMNAPIKSMIIRYYDINTNSEVEIILDPSCIPEEVKT